MSNFNLQPKDIRIAPIKILSILSLNAELKEESEYKVNVKAVGQKLSSNKENVITIKIRK